MSAAGRRGRGAAPGRRRAGRDLPFFATLGGLTAAYALLIIALLAADVAYGARLSLATLLSSREILYAAQLSLVSATVSTILSLWIAVPAGYLLSRYAFPGRALLDALFDVPIVLPPMVIGVSLLVLFHLPAGEWFQRHVLHVTYEVPAVILAQFVVAAAFAIRTMRVTFDQIDPRCEQVARTLGCSRGQAFTRVAVPEAWRGVVTAGTLAWARSLGEFGPVLVFAGATRMKTEVLPTTVFLELSVGNVDAALAVSLLMVAAAFVVLSVARLVGMREGPL